MTHSFGTLPEQLSVCQHPLPNLGEGVEGKDKHDLETGLLSVPVTTTLPTSRSALSASTATVRISRSVIGDDWDAVLERSARKYLEWIDQHFGEIGVGPIMFPPACLGKNHGCGQRRDGQGGDKSAHPRLP